jgi:hypothetical protein
MTSRVLARPLLSHLIHRLPNARAIIRFASLRSQLGPAASPTHQPRDRTYKSAMPAEFKTYAVRWTLRPSICKCNWNRITLRDPSMCGANYFSEVLCSILVTNVQFIFVGVVR